MKRQIPVLLALLAVVPFASQAQWYAGASLGQGKTDIDGSSRSAQLLDLGFDAAQTSADDTDTAARIFGGYRLHRYLAVEGGYLDLGRFEQRSSVAPAGRLSSETRVAALDLSVLGLLPIGERFTLFARGGGFSARTRTSFEGAGSVQLVDGGSRSHRSSGLVLGAGAMAAISPRISVRLDWTRLRRAVDDRLSPREDADAWLLGLAYTF